METSVTLVRPGHVSFSSHIVCGFGTNNFTLETNGITAISQLGDCSALWKQHTVPLPPGTHVLRWTFRTGPIGDEASAGWLDQVKIVGTEPLPPIAITSPPDGATYNLATNITIAAELSNFSNPTQVEFFANNTKIGEANTGPQVPPAFAPVFTWTNPPIGSHLLTVRVFSATSGATSAPVRAVITGNGIDAGCAGSLDPSFLPHVDHVRKVAVQPDGKVLAFGALDALVPRLVRFNADGSRDRSFSASMDEPTALLVQPDGRILVVGDGVVRLQTNGAVDLSFSNYLEHASVYAAALQPDGKVIVSVMANEDTDPVFHVMRVGADGAPDPTFQATEFVGPQRALLLRSDGKIVVGGAADPAYTRSTLVLLNPDGSVDSSFASRLGEIGLGPMALQPDNRVLIASWIDGSLTVVRLNHDGSRDDTFKASVFETASWVQPEIHSLLVQPDGRILVGGMFEQVDGIRRDLVARLNANGSLDSSFEPYAATCPGCDAHEVQRIWSMTLDQDGRLLLGGHFTQVSGVWTHGLARLHLGANDCSGVISIDAAQYVFPETNGAATLVLHRRGDTNRAAEVLFSTVPAYLEAAPDADFIPVSGKATFAPGQTTYSISVPLIDDSALEKNKTFYMEIQPLPGQAVLGSPSYSTVTIVDDEGAGWPGSVDASFFPLGNASVTALAVEPDGNILVAATSDSGLSKTALLRLNSNGSLAKTLVSNITGHVSALVVDTNDSSIIMGGYFSTSNGAPLSNLIRLAYDGSPVHSFMPAPNGPVFAMALLPGGDVFVAGQFSQVAGEPRMSIARLNSSGTLDPSFNPGSLATVYASGTDSGSIFRIAVQPDGKVVIGGTFNRVDGLARTNLARLNANGSPDPTFDPGWIWYNSVASLHIQPDGNLLVAGSINLNPEFVCCDNRFGIVRLTPSGAPDPAFTRFEYTHVGAMAVQPDGKIIVDRRARLNFDGTFDRSFFTGYAPGDGDAGSLVHAVALQSDGNILVGGRFGHHHSLPLRGLVRLHGGALTRASDGVFEFAAAATEVLEGVPSVAVTLTRSFASNGPVTVTYETRDGTALAGRDYTDSSGQATFAAGEITKTVLIPIINNTNPVGPRTFTLHITGITGDAMIGLRGTETITIQEDDMGVVFDRMILRVPENQTAAGVVIRRIGPTNTTLTVRLTAADGTATAGVDYFGVATNLHFYPGQVSVLCAVPLHNDSVAEPDETVLLTLYSAATGAEIRALATLIISDDDRVPRIFPSGIGSGSFSLTFDAPPHTYAIIEASDDLVDWTMIGNFYRSPEDPPITFSDAISTNTPARFYRFRSP